MRRALFIHVFKAGGTSVSDWLERRQPNGYVPPDPTAFHHAVQTDPYAIRRYRLIRGHIFIRDARQFADTHKLLTVIRQPEAQLMSALWHFACGAGATRDHDRFTTSQMDALLAQAEEFRRTGAAMQSAFLADDPERITEQSVLSGLDRCHAVGVTEDLPATFRRFAWTLRTLPPLRSPHARNSGAGTVEMPRAIRNLLDRHLHLDTLLYDAARKRLGQFEGASLTHTWA